MQKQETVGERQDFLYLKNDKDLLIVYKKILEILAKEFKFDKISEKGPTKYEPVKPKFGAKIIAVKEKDTRTKLEITVKISYKKPEVKHRSSKDTFMVNLSYSGAVTTEYKKETERQRSVVHGKLINFMEKSFFKKERTKYIEECEELVEAIRRRVRELYEEIPSVGRSSRSYYEHTW